MLIGVVTGTVVANQKDERLLGQKFHIVRQVDLEGKPTGAYVVAVDAIGVGPGEYVLFATGSSARQTSVTENRPIDATIMAIVDTWELGGDVKYEKQASLVVQES